MELFDISVAISAGMVVYEGDPPVVVERVASIAAGDGLNLSRMACGLHTGTHIDAPVHFIDGAAGVDALALDALIGPALVVDATGMEGDIGSKALAALAIPAGTERVLFKTRNSALWDLGAFSREFAGLTAGAASELAAAGTRLVGIDYLSIAPFADPAPAHVALLAAGIVVVESLDLRRIEPGAYTLICLPLKVSGADGAPARAVLTRP